MHKGQARYLKSQPPWRYGDEINDDGEIVTVYDRSKLIANPDIGHLPNKNEAKTLRRLCAETGLTPDQVRLHKKYRQILAQAAGPQFRQRCRHDPYKGMTAEERDRQQFAESRHITTTHKHFSRLYAAFVKERTMQAVMAKLMEPWG
jgi:hypothetical protein